MNVTYSVRYGDGNEGFGQTYLPATTDLCQCFRDARHATTVVDMPYSVWEHRDGWGTLVAVFYPAAGSQSRLTVV